MAKAAGHEVVRLPPYHCELNPIELAWSQVKRFIKENNMLFTLTAVKELTYKGFEQVVLAQWKKLINHVQREFEDKYWTDDGLQEEIVDEFVFLLAVLMTIHPVRATPVSRFRVIVIVINIMFLHALLFLKL